MAKAKQAPQVPGAEPTQPESTDQPQAETPVDNGRPDISEVDPKTISKPVLTKQGWVCPG